MHIAIILYLNSLKLMVCILKSWINVYGSTASTKLTSGQNTRESKFQMYIHRNQQ